MFPAIDRSPASREALRGAIWARLRGVMPRALGPNFRSPNPDRAPHRTPARPRLKRAGRALIALCGGATILIGCPLYSDECDSWNDCASGFYCDGLSRHCEPIFDAIGCVRPSQCEVGETCTPDFVCRPGSCDYHGCVRGYRCGVVDFTHTCVPVVGDAGPEDASPPSRDGGDGTADLDAGADAGDAGADASQ